MQQTTFRGRTGLFLHRTASRGAWRGDCALRCLSRPDRGRLGSARLNPRLTLTLDRGYRIRLADRQHWYVIFTAEATVVALGRVGGVV